MRDVYLSSWADIDESDGPEDFTFEDWLAKGCPSFLDYFLEEQRVVEQYLVDARPA